MRFCDTVISDIHVCSAFDFTYIYDINVYMIFIKLMNKLTNHIPNNPYLLQGLTDSAAVVYSTHRFIQFQLHFKGDIPNVMRFQTFSPTFSTSSFTQMCLRKQKTTIFHAFTLSQHVHTTLVPHTPSNSTSFEYITHMRTLRVRTRSAPQPLGSDIKDRARTAHHLESVREQQQQHQIRQQPQFRRRVENLFSDSSSASSSV